MKKSSHKSQFFSLYISLVEKILYKVSMLNDIDYQSCHQAHEWHITSDITEAIPFWLNINFIAFLQSFSVKPHTEKNIFLKNMYANENLIIIFYMYYYTFLYSKEINLTIYEKKLNSISYVMCQLLVRLNYWKQISQFEI